MTGTEESELYVLAQSHARIDKERAMRRRRLKWLRARLKQIAAMNLSREELHMKCKSLDFTHRTMSDFAIHLMPDIIG